MDLLREYDSKPSTGDKLFDELIKLENKKLILRSKIIEKRNELYQIRGGEAQQTLLELPPIIDSQYTGIDIPRSRKQMKKKIYQLQRKNRFLGYQISQINRKLNLEKESQMTCIDHVDTDRVDTEQSWMDDFMDYFCYFIRCIESAIDEVLSIWYDMLE